MVHELILAFAAATSGEAGDDPLDLKVEIVGPDAAATDGKPFGPEGYELVRGARGELTVRAGDERGARYGRFDVTDWTAAGRELAQLPVGSAVPVRRPKLAHRQFKLNLPLAGTGYLSAEALQHNAWFWDEEYWDDFLDLLAHSRFNVLSLWSAHPYPQMVRLEKFPEVQDITKAELERNVALFHSICGKAKARGIDLMLVTWNCHVSPSFAKAHGIADAGVDSPLVRDYMKECVRALLVEYPEIRWIGTCPGEAMPQDARGREEFIRDTYVAGITASGRKDVRFMHRYWGAEPDALRDVLAPACSGDRVPLAVSIKFNGEHMYSWPSPHFFDPRFADPAFRKWDVIWHLRNDDLFTLRWGDPQFVRATVKSCAKDGIGFLTGSEIWIDGADYIHTDAAKSHVTWKWDFDRLWLRYELWGRLGYDPEAPDSVFEDLVAAHFGRAAAPVVFRATVAASRLDPLLTSFHWNYMNGDWYPEGCVGSWVTGDEFHRGRNLRLNDTIFHDVLEFIFNQTVDDELACIPEYVAHRLADRPLAAGRRGPLEVADEMDRNAGQALIRDRVTTTKNQSELGCWLTDVRQKAALARYYAAKIRGATHLALHMAGFPGEQEQAITQLGNAVGHWRQAAELGDAHWREHEVWLMGPFSWGRYVKEVERDVEIAKRCKSDADGARRCRAFQLPFDTHLDFNTLAGELDLGVAPFDPPPPATLADATTYLETEEFTGPWREQANYPGFRGRGFRCANVLGSVAKSALRRRIEVTIAGRYAVWVRGLVGHASDRKAERSSQAAVDGVLLAATQKQIGADPRFTWEKAGEIELAAGAHELELRDHGPGFEHPDCVALSRDLAFDPSITCVLPPIVPDGPQRFRAALESLLQRQLAPAPAGGTPAVPATAAACRARQEEIRRAFLEAIGLARLPDRTPLNVRSAGVLDRGDYTVEKIVFESRPRFYVPAHVWRPKGAGPFPGVAVPVGHWMQEGKLAVPMQGLGQALARRGYVALIYDPVDQGERRVAGMSHRLALPLMTAGECDLTYLLWDTVRALDVLEARPDVDRSRLAVTGCSGAGMNTCYLSFLDPRVKAAAPCCYFSTYESILATANHCEDNFVPGILRQGNMADVVALAAPKPLIALNATRDEIFPVPASEAALARLNLWYERLGAPAPMELFLDESEHDYSKPMRERCVAFLERHVRGRADAPPSIPESWETTLVPFDDPAWRCLPEGWPKDGRSLEELTRETIGRALDRRAAAPLADGEQRRLARELLDYTDAEASVESRGSTTVQGVVVETFGLAVDGFPLTAALLHAPGAIPAGARLRVELDDRGLHARLDEGWSELARRVSIGGPLLLIDPCGRGDTAEDEEHAWRLLTYVGRPLLGLRAIGVAAAARNIGEQAGVTPDRLLLHGNGVESGLLALLTSRCSGIAFGGGETGFGSLRELVDRFDAHPAICVPRLLELGELLPLKPDATPSRG